LVVESLLHEGDYEAVEGRCPASTDGQCFREDRHRPVDLGFVDDERWCQPQDVRLTDPRAQPADAQALLHRGDRDGRGQLRQSAVLSGRGPGVVPGAAIVNSMVQYSSTVDRAFTALADPTRRAVLERLGAGSASISELTEPFGMSLTGMKKHVRLLEEAELVTTEKVGRVRRCMLVPYAFEGISTWLQRLDRFAQVVERTKGAA
jgi:DNA-binding transcriptional ArsR family regulator